MSTLIKQLRNAGAEDYQKLFLRIKMKGISLYFNRSRLKQDIEINFNEKNHPDERLEELRELKKKFNQPLSNDNV